MSHPSHIPALDGLRGGAALIVVVSHSANAGLLPSVLGQGFGQMGVALFYGLSGFLMGHLYLHQPATPQAVIAFFRRRAARVLPLFYVVLGVAVVARLTTGTVFYEIWTPEVLIRNAGLVQGSSVLWSVPVEVQFYLVFACLWLARQRWDLGPPALLALGLGLQGLGLVALHLAGLAGGGLTLAQWGHLFLAGLGMALVQSGQARVRWSVLFCLLLPLALPEVRRTIGLPVLSGSLDPISAGLPLLLLALTLWRGPGFRGLAARPLRWLGGISFGLYLIHPPVITLAEALGQGFLFVLGLSLALALLARHLVERPAQRALLRPGRMARTSLS